MRTVGVRGRDGDLAVIDARIQSAVAGRGGVLLIDGPAGIGKTALAEEAGRRAARAGLRILRVDAGPGTRAPFAALLAATAPDDHNGLRDVPDRDPWLVLDVRAALTGAAARTPMMVAVDDLHLADDETAAAIGAMADIPGLLWMLVVRRGHAGAAVADLLTGLKSAGAAVVRLGPLSQAAAVRVVEDLTGSAAGATLTDLAATAGGHPLWLTELVRGLLEDQRLKTTDGYATVDGAGPPRRVVAALTQRLAILAEPSRRLIQLAAALPPRFTAGQLAGLLDCRPTDLMEPLDSAVQADILDMGRQEIEFASALLRDATRAMQPDSLLRTLERQAAGVLLRTGTSPVEVAAMLIRTAEVGDRAALAALRLSAEEIAVTDPGAAADLTLRILRLLPAGDAELGPLVVSALPQLRRAGRADEARKLAADALAGPLPIEQEGAIRLSLASTIASTLPERIDVNRRAMTIGGLEAPAQHGALLSYNLLLHGDLAESARQARTALAAATAAGDDEAAAIARVVLAGVHCAQGNGQAAADELDRRPAALPGTGTVWIKAVNVLQALGRADDAEAEFTAGVRRARRDRDAMVMVAAEVYRTAQEVVHGRLAEAREAAQPFLQGDEPLTHHTLLRTVGAAAIAVHLDDHALARTAATMAKRIRTGGNKVGLRWSARMLAATALGRNDPAQAAQLLADDPLLPSPTPFLFDLANLTLVARIARLAHDAGLTERVLAAAATLDADSAGAPAFAAAAAHIRALISNDAEELLAAAQLQTHARRPLLAAGAREDAGRALLASARTPQGLACLNDAFDGYLGCGAKADTNRVRRLLRQHGTKRQLSRTRRPDSGWESLTEAELKVIRQIAGGATNRLAAERLFLSAHTINAHLRSAFAKLGVRTRVELTNMLRDNGG